jgi:hypothetical protein
MGSSPAFARPVTLPSFVTDSAAAPVDPWAVSWIANVAAPDALPALTLQPPAASTSPGNDPQTPRTTVAFEYSDAYQLRRKIHKYASFATIPLFATEIALGQSIYSDTPTTRSSNRGLHGAVGTAIGILFAANTFTGVWNLWESRHDPNGGKMRWVHGALMIAADFGFLATAAAVPNRRSLSGLINYETDKATHRDIAYATIGVATVGYTIMLFHGK